MNIKLVLYILILPTLLLSLSEEELNEIENKVEDVIVAPDFELFSIKSDSLDTKEFSYIEEDIILSELKGSVVLLNFWATWCGPCRMEIPDLNELYAEYKDEGLEILGISTSDGKQALVNFKKAYAITYPLLYGTPQTLQEIMMNYGGIYSIPTSILINKNTEVVRVYNSAILKQYDPYMYQDLLLHIKESLSAEYEDSIKDTQ